MTDPFDWQIGEEDDELPPFEGNKRPSHRFWLGPLMAVVGTAVVMALLFSGFQTGSRRITEVEDDVRQLVQDHLDLQVEAVLEGDGDLFFSLHEDDPAWRTAQLLPANQAFYKAVPQVTRAQNREGIIWANVSTTKGSQPIQRIMFFEQVGGGMHQVSTDPAYWGPIHQALVDWGNLRYYEIDKALADEFETFVADVIDRTCAQSCIESQLEFQLEIGSSYRQTAVADKIIFPSPRLLALDGSGAPADAYWEQLEAEIVTHITPAVVRFGVPASMVTLMDYESAAEKFSLRYPHIQIELVLLESNNPDLLSFEGLDGATLFPTESMLASGQVRNLTDFLNSDPTFNQSDFYEQIWQGAWWQEQFWLVPQAGHMRLFYYDRNAYREINAPEPSLRWTWEEMERDMARFADAPINPDWGFLDAGNDALFSYAYNWDNTCTELATVRCKDTLERRDVAAALEWYADLSGRPGYIPDMTRLKLPLPTSNYDQEARTVILSNWQSAQRRAVIWIEDPILYELRFQLSPMGVVPFPGSDRFDGISPIWVQGHLVFQHSERPLATWQWISFLSNQPIASQFRYVPARPSQATLSLYWSTLPRQLSDPMRTAFPFARPIKIEEQAYFSWDQITAVLTQEATPQEAARLIPDINWFNHQE